jgi:hypothetical protein
MLLQQDLSKKPYVISKKLKRSLNFSLVDAKLKKE